MIIYLLGELGSLYFNKSGSNSLSVRLKIVEGDTTGPYRVLVFVSVDAWYKEKINGSDTGVNIPKPR